MFDVIRSGGLLMVPIFLCAVYATFIIIERVLYFSAMKKQNVQLLKDLESCIADRDFEKAAILCDDAGTPAAKLIQKAIVFRNYPDKDVRDAVESEANRQIPNLEKFLTSLGTIANISTLLGLLGTVTGNIQAFGVLGEAGTMGNPALLAGSIAQALVTTAAGLFVSIPAVIFYNHFVSRVNRHIADMESTVSDMMIRLSARDKFL